MEQSFNVGGQGAGNNWDFSANTSVAGGINFNPANPAAFFTSTIAKAEQLQHFEQGYQQLPGQPVLNIPLSSDPSAGFAAMQHLYDFPNVLANVINASGPPQGSALYSFLENASQDPPPEIVAAANALGVPPAELYMAVESQGISAFNSLVASAKLPGTNTNLSPTQANQLMMAFFGLSQPSSLSPQLQTLLSQFTNQIYGALSEEFGMNLTFPAFVMDSTQLQAQISAGFDEDFQTKLQALVHNGTLTQAQANTVLAMHYDPSMASSSDPLVNQTYITLTKEATANTQQEYGTSNDFTPQSTPGYYANAMNGAFVQAFITLANSQTPPLTSDQIAEVIANFANPSAASQDIQALIKSITTQATASVQAQYGLSSTWKPTVTSLNASSLSSATLNIANAALATARDVLYAANQLVVTGPGGPAQMVFMNFLKIIGQAINNMQLAVYAMSTAESELDNKMSAMKLNMELDKIQRQENAEAAAKGKEGKMAHSGLGSFLSGFTKFLIVALGACMGPLTLALAIVYVTKPSVLDNAMSSIVNSCKSTFGNTAGEIIGSLVNVVVAMVLSGGNPMLYLTLLCDQSGPIQTFVAGCGGNAEAQAIAAAVVQGIVMIVVCVVICILTGGMAAPAAFAAIAAAIGVAAETVATAATVVMVVFQIAMTCLQIAADGIQINNDILMSEIVMIKAKMEADAQQTEAIIQLITQMINTLLNVLNSNGDWIVDMSNFQSEKYKEANQIDSQLCG